MKKSHLCKALVAFAVAACSSFSVSQAVAAPIVVTDWSYTLNAAFSGATFTSGDGSTNVQPGVVSWGAWFGDYNGVQRNRSALVLGSNPSSGNVQTNNIAAPGIGSSLTHHNNVLDGSFATLRTASLQATLNLTPLAPPPPGGTFSLPSLTFNIGFAETPNAAPCADAGSPTPCNDIFVMNSGNLNQSFTYNHNGSGLVEYLISIFPISGGGVSPLVPLSPTVCAAAGAAPGCLGFTTAENQATTIQFGFVITTKPVTVGVAEPAVLALFGAGLFGLGLIRQRRKS